MRDRSPSAVVHAALPCLIATLASACAFGDRAARDAAQEPAWPPGREWRIEPEPALVIGAPGATDGIEFYVYQRRIADVSSVFLDMFSAPSYPSAAHNRSESVNVELDHRASIVMV